ncbi:thioredoxin family protein [Candidatus Dojkabacteria bacterium]|uniref:Thioredoxin family protein n=1 Tax=Candidatus Dojkabacteria bacterium TaxID=2099670 RepID=A0A955L433_9BACT|nr:thioredoxin family protein [Candidatus Dojkabacteria bacterium]
MQIQVVGSGCPTCKKLYELTQKAVAELELPDTVSYLTGDEGTEKIIELGAMSSPLLLINDEIAMIGFTPDLNKIKAIILSFS